MTSIFFSSKFFSILINPVTANPAGTSNKPERRNAIRKPSAWSSVAGINIHANDTGRMNAGIQG